MSERIEQRAADVLHQAGIPVDAGKVIDVLSQAGIALADATRLEMVCRWVSVDERPVPPDADTIIRTITTTSGNSSWSTTHWLEGLRSPR
jgi:hypothetical protein